MVTERLILSRLRSICLGLVVGSRKQKLYSLQFRQFLNGMTEKAGMGGRRGGAVIRLGGVEFKNLLRRLGRDNVHSCRVTDE